MTDMNHKCKQIPAGVKIYSLDNDENAKQSFSKTSWWIEINNGKSEIHSCPFCSKTFMGREYLYIIDRRNGKEVPVEENMITVLWENDILYELPVRYVDEEGNKQETIGLYVNCNDVFWWAVADCEPIPYDEIQTLYELCFNENGEKKRFGSVIWACLKRGMRPQHPIEDEIKKEGAWTPELESLPVRDYTG